MQQVGATLHRGARASHYRGLSCCGAQAPDVQAQQLWFTGLVAPGHVGSSQTRARTHVPCIGRQILNHCATREAQLIYFLIFIYLFGCVGSLLQHVGSLDVACRLFSCGMHVGSSSWTRDRTQAPCSGSLES